MVPGRGFDSLPFHQLFFSRQLTLFQEGWKSRGAGCRA
jgi:hypothetical protein